MKKFSALILVLLLCLSSVSFAAGASIRLYENSDIFDVRLVLPDGASELPERSNRELGITAIQKEGLASVSVSIAASEIYAGRNMKDFSESEMEEMRNIVGAPYDDPIFSTEVTPSGNVYLHLCSNEADEIDSIFTVYEGYFVELIQYNDDFSALSEQDLYFCLELLYNISFVPVQ